MLILLRRTLGSPKPQLNTVQYAALLHTRQLIIILRLNLTSYPQFELQTEGSQTEGSGALKEAAKILGRF
jgi:hypothetical protein